MIVERIALFGALESTQNRTGHRFDQTRLKASAAQEIPVIARSRKQVVYQTWMGLRQARNHKKWAAKSPKALAPQSFQSMEPRRLELLTPCMP
ncbi:MAG: hypothetical protein CBE41_04370 [Gammaproteobacteria bacterium TMED281]|nr:MAG: hypothetical protein CBE41_04370 [Gammaproteobacteria bacterium TMED281]